MKIVYYLILYIGLFVTALWVQFFSGWEPFVITPVIANIIIFIARKPLLIFSAYIIKKQIYRVAFSTIIDLIWFSFIFWLVLLISIDLFIALISFLIITISFTFKNIIKNMASGALLLTSEQFEIGDLIETNNIQGIVKEITLNYTKLREFDGVEIIIPNSSVFGATITRFTNKKLKTIEELRLKDGYKKDERVYQRYIKHFRKLWSIETKITRYTKQVEILGSIDPFELEDHLSKVFDKYEQIFGIKPEYSIHMTRYGRIRITLYLISKKSKLILNYIDAFLRDIVFQLYSEQIYEGWEDYKKVHEKQVKLETKNKKEVSDK